MLPTKNALPAVLSARVMRRGAFGPAQAAPLAVRAGLIGDPLGIKLERLREHLCAHDIDEVRTRATKNCDATAGADDE